MLQMARKPFMVPPCGSPALRVKTIKKAKNPSKTALFEGFDHVLTGYPGRQAFRRP
jgi:hypothetical protein